MLGERAENLFTPGLNGSTFGGNPVCAAGALSVINRIDEPLLASVREKSAYIFDELSGASGVKSVSGKGFMLGIETEKPAKEVIASAMEKGVLVLSAKTKVRLLPPLNITFDLLEIAMDKLLEAIAE